MARDSQAALVELNRFGFGARGGASDDFVNAASARTAGIVADAGIGRRGERRPGDFRLAGAYARQSL